VKFSSQEETEIEEQLIVEQDEAKDDSEYVKEPRHWTLRLLRRLKPRFRKDTRGGQVKSVRRRPRALLQRTEV
jgi:hypothetical protein